MFSTAQGERTAVGVKAHVLFGRLLKDDLVWELLHAESVGEIAERLRRAPGYQAHLETLPPRDVHRYDLEALLKTIPLTEAAAFLNYLNGPRDAFLRAWVERHEADNLKSLLRWILSGRQDREELRRRLWMVPASPLSYDLLLSARDFPEFLEALRGTRYFPVIREPMKRLVEGEGNLFSLEMALDIHAEARIHQALLDLEPEDRRPLMPLFGGRFDLLNLYWLYRGKRFYRMTPEELMNRLLPCRYRIGFPLFRRMARAQTLEEALEALSHTPYVRVFHESAPQDELVVERDIKRFLLLAARGIFRAGPPAFHTAMSYFMLRELEVEDLTTIIEDVRYDYDRRHAAVYLARPILSGGDNPWQ